MIKKYKLNPIIEFLCISFPFLFVFLAIQYLPFDLMVLASFIVVIPVIITVINYKWYQLNILIKDGTLFIKRVSLHKKTENFSILNKVQKEFFNYEPSALATTYKNSNHLIA
jgi:hypothetical protein